MKFRTDFVTNSSDSSFLVFNIKNKSLFKALTSLGIKIREVDDGQFMSGMKIELPSGKTAIIGRDENWSQPFFANGDSISAWLLTTILWEVLYPSFDHEDGPDFAREFIDILNKADITHLDWKLVETWSQESVFEDFEKAFGAMDGDIEAAYIEHAYAFEGDVGPIQHTEIEGNKRMDAGYYYEDRIKTEDCEGRKFVVTGKLKLFENRDKIVKFIEDAGGSVTEAVSENTAYLISNEVNSNSTEMKKAKELGIAVLPEVTFIRKFGKPKDIGNLMTLEDIAAEAWKRIWIDNVGLLDFIVEAGTRPIVMEVWKDGKWVQNASEAQKTARNF